MKIVFANAPTFELTRAGKPSVRVQSRGGELVVRGYRGQDVTGPTGALLRHQLDSIDEEHDKKAARAAALKEAASNPVQGIVFFGADSRVADRLLVPVGVRGVDRREALVTYESGVKGSVDPRHLLRPLSDEERVELTDAVHLVRTTGDQVSRGVSRWAAKDGLEAVAHVRFDAAEDRWEATSGDVTVVGESAYEVTKRVETSLLLSAYQYGVSDGLTFPLADLVSGGGALLAEVLFETREAALEHVACEERQRDAVSALSEVVGRLRLDLSRWDSD